MERPALQKLLIDVQARRIDVIVVYKVDRLTKVDCLAASALSG
jgi:DNA invertase Pin-like site-specific DNA recombinase